MDISVCIIAKDEEKYIGGCLKKLKPYGFEIIVTDTGSTDKTYEIASQYADQVLTYSWTDDFSAARNFCASHAANDWILVLDCDEYLERVNILQIGQLRMQYPNLTGAIQLKNLIIRADDTKGYSKDIVPRFYNRKKYHYENSIHEQLVSNKKNRQKENQSYLLPVEVVHYGYMLSPEDMQKKQERNLQLLYHQLETKGENPYLCFQIGQSELVLNHCDFAIDFYEKGLAYGESCSLSYVQYMIEGLAKAYVMVGRQRDALQLMEKYEGECEYAKYVFYYANVLMDNGEYLRALMKYVKATMMDDTDTLGEELIFCYKHIVELYHKFGAEDKAEIFKDKYEQYKKLYTYN